MRTWAVVALLLTPGPLAAQGVRFDGGLGVATGTYLFEERTTTWWVSGGLGLELGAFTLRGSIPLLFQNSTLIAGSGAGNVPTGGSSSGTVADSGRSRHGDGDGRGGTMAGGAPELSHGVVEVPASAATEYQSALGDPTVSLSWRTRAARSTTLGLGATVKVPVADTSTFGTGEWDVGFNAGVSHALGERLLLGVDLAYWRLGDLDDLELRDPVYGTASLGYLGAGGWGGTVLASGGTAVLDGYDPPFSLGAGVHRFRDGRSLSALATIGLTETAPDFTLGLLWGIRLAGW